MKRNVLIAATILMIVTTFAVIADEQKDVREITITISGMNYEPAEVSVAKGEPVRLIFERDEKPTCGGTILFPELGIERKLEAGEKAVVELTPEEADVLNFTCGMKMMKGKIVVRSN